MTDLTQISSLLKLIAGILGFVLLVMMLAVIRRLQGGLLYRALIPWTIALFVIGLNAMIDVIAEIPAIINDGVRLLLIVLFLLGGIILWNRLREVS